jgi:hypothetical protein
MRSPVSGQPRGSRSTLLLVRDDVMEATAGRQEPYTYLVARARGLFQNK